MLTADRIKIVLASSLQGPDPVTAPLPSVLWSSTAKVEVLVDLSNCTFIRPGGLAFVYSLSFTLLELGHAIRLREPTSASARDYLRRSDFWGLMARLGATVPNDWLGYNIGGAAGLVEPSMIRTTASIRENIASAEMLYDRLNAAVAKLDAEPKVCNRVASVFVELSNNAAEHSKSPRGAFVMAQVFPKASEIEIAVSDVGIGIREALNNPSASSDAAAVFIALQQLVTGRRDGAGNPVEGGYGLPTVAAESSSLQIRSGKALLSSSGRRNVDHELVMTSMPCDNLMNTLVVSRISL